jgi:O-antigen ligase/tetratricopeptide (TPR) repeat protein
MRFRDWVSAVGALAAVAVAIFAVGGVPRWAQAIVAVLVAISVASSGISKRGFTRVSPLVALLGAACVFTFIQLLPLGAIVDLLTPTLAAMRSDGSQLLDVSPWNAFTSDASATLVCLIMLLTLVGLALVTLRMATSERGRFRIVAAVAALCGLVAAVTWFHRLFGLRKLYGFYTPEYADPGMLGPLLNSNSLACLTAVGAVLAIGLAAYPRQPGVVRASWLVVVVACGLVTVSTISRGATLALIGGGLVTIGVLVAQRFMGERVRRKRARVFSGAVPIGVLAGCLVVLVIYSNAGNVERQLSQLSFDEVGQSRSKFAAWHSAATLIEESPWSGVGRGAFEAPFTRVHAASGVATYAFLENEYLQAVVDWGIPAALVLGFALLWLAYTAARRWRDGPLAAGALGGLAVVAMQSNVDFGLQFLGLAAPVTAIAATLAYAPLRELERPRRARVARFSHVAVLALGAVALMSSITTTLDEDRRAISARPTLERVRESVERHPLDYYGYAVAAELASHAKDRNAIRLLNHAMALHPTHPQLHRMAARMLLVQGRTSQAAIEYAAALRTSPDPKATIVEILDRLSADDAAAALPIDYPYPEAFVRILGELSRPDVARTWLTRVLTISPSRSRACDLMFVIARNGDIGAARIAGNQCGEHLPDYQVRIQLAQLLVSKDAHSEAIALLRDVETWQARREEKVDAWFVLCDAQRTLRQLDEAKRCLRRLDASTEMIPERRKEILTRIEEINDPSRAASGTSVTP